MADEIELSDEDGADEFYFESDYLALKSNKDYRKILRTILILQVQRSQAIKVSLCRLMRLLDRTIPLSSKSFNLNLILRWYAG